MLRRRSARTHLIDFARYIDPFAAPQYDARHLRFIAEYLEALERREITRLIISTPPRHWKSSLTSEKFPAWYLGRNPSHAIIVSSYAGVLAQKFSRSVRETISSNPRYQQLFPDVHLRRDSNRVDDWLLEQGVRSSFRAAGVGGGVTGMGARLIVIDDPISDAEAANSEVQRESLWDWYRLVLRSRLEPDGAIVLIQTRWHESDLAGKLIHAQEQAGGEHWEVLNLDVLIESEEDEKADPLGRRLGEPLWDRFSPAELSAIKSSVGPYAWRTLYKGKPTLIEGSLIKRPWFQFVPSLPEGVTWQAQAIDGAFTEKQLEKDDPDFTARVMGARGQDLSTWHPDQPPPPARLYLGLPLLTRKSIYELPAFVVSAKARHPTVRLGMGQLAIKASIAQAMRVAGLPLEFYPETSDKISRASAWIAWASAGRVFLVGTPEEWEPFLAQWVAFPHGAHDDAIDCVSGVAQMLGVKLDLPAPSPRQAPVLRTSWKRR